MSNIGKNSKSWKSHLTPPFIKMSYSYFIFKIWELFILSSKFDNYLFYLQFLRIIYFTFNFWELFILASIFENYLLYLRFLRIIYFIFNFWELFILPSIFENYLFCLQFLRIIYFIFNFWELFILSSISENYLFYLQFLRIIYFIFNLWRLFILSSIFENYLFYLQFLRIIYFIFNFWELFILSSNFENYSSLFQILIIYAFELMSWNLNKCVRRTKWSSHHSIVSLPLRAEPIKTLLPTPVKKGPYGGWFRQVWAWFSQVCLRRDHLGGLARQNWPHRSSKEWTLRDWLNPKQARVAELKPLGPSRGGPMRLIELGVPV